MIEGLQNPAWMAQMDQILKQIGTEKAAEHFKVSIQTPIRVTTLIQKIFIRLMDCVQNSRNYMYLN